MSPRRRPADRWPWPEDSPLRRRERTGLGYRDALRRVMGYAARCPAGCVPPELRDVDQALDEFAAKAGQTWVLTERRQLHDEELLTTEEVAELWGVEPRTVDQWHNRDGLAHVQTPDGVRYRHGTIVEFHRGRQVRAKQRRGGPHRYARNI